MLGGVSSQRRISQGDVMGSPTAARFEQIRQRLRLALLDADRLEAADEVVGVDHPANSGSQSQHRSRLMRGSREAMGGGDARER